MFLSDKGPIFKIMIFFTIFLKIVTPRTNTLVHKFKRKLLMSELHCQSNRTL